MEPTKTPAKVIAALALCFVVRFVTATPPGARGSGGSATHIIVVEALPYGERSGRAGTPARDAALEVPLFFLQPAARGRAAWPSRGAFALVLYDRTGGDTRLVTAHAGLLGLARATAGGRGTPAVPVFALRVSEGKALVVVGPPGISWAVLDVGESWGERLEAGDGSPVVVRAVNVGSARAFPPAGEK